MLSPRTFLICLAAATSGCGNHGVSAPSPGSAPAEVAASGSMFEVRSGTALKARWLVGEGGARVFDGFSYGEFPCSFSWVEGRTVCNPGVLQRARPLFDSFFYADERCSEPLLPKGPGSHTQFVHGTCPLAIAVFEPEPTPAEYTTVYQGDGQRCWQVPEAETPPGLYRGTDITAKVAGGRLVRGPARDGWAPLFAEGDDGARAFVAWIRVRDGAFCSFGLEDAVQGKGRCLPYALSTGEAFADARCTSPVASSGFPAPCDRPVFIRGQSSACDDGTLHEAGARLMESFHRGAGGTCVGGRSSAAAFDLGPAVARETFPAGTLRVVAGPGRLRPLAIDGPLGLTPVEQAFWDRQLETVCRAGSEGGEVRKRCEPLARWVSSVLFADAACTVEVLSVDRCGPAYGFARQNVFLSGGGGFTRMYKVRGPHAGPIFVHKDGVCAPGTPEAGQQLLAAERLDPDIAFARVELETDP
jgi:hypothetical protein